MRLGIVALFEGDWTRATNLYEECLAVYRQLGNTWGIAMSLANLGEAALAQGQWDRAANFYRESLAVMQATGSQWYLALALLGLAGATVRQGKSERAARLLGAGEALLQTIEGSLPPFERQLYERSVDATRAALSETIFETILAEGRTMSAAQAVSYALTDEIA